MMFQMLVRIPLEIGFETQECYILAKNISTFCPSPESLCEAEFKGDGLINLAEDISRQPSIQGVSRVWLAAFSQIYSEN
jgi:hypothetical protein